MDTSNLSGTVLEQYRIDALIGRGGMGEVYRAYDTTLNRFVAVKVLPAAIVDDEQSLARFVQEARSASALNHPHVVAIYQIGRAIPSRPEGGASGQAVNYIAMELVAGTTLRALIETRRLELKRALEYLAQAADALAAAHAAGIVHRDFKPDNVMVAEGGYVKVLDFGLAKARVETLLDHAETQRAAVDTAPGAILGTVGYMSPEQAEGRTADHRSDIFSFGCVLYEAATGARAFQGTSSVDTLHRIIHADPEPVTGHAPAAPTELQRIIRKCLAKDRDARYQSMKDVAIDLRALRQELDSTPSAVATPPTKARRAAPVLVLLALGVVAIAAIAGWRVWNGRAAPTAPAAPMNIERLTGSGTVIDAVISPDGKYVAYVESRGGDQSLWLRQLSGTEPLQLVAAARVGYWGIQFANDSSSIFYSLKGPSYPSGHLFRIPLLGGASRLLLAGIDSAVSSSPDGQQLTYLRENFPERGASAVMVADANGANARPLAVKRPPLFFAPGFFVAPAWSPDGQRIAVGVRNSATRDGVLITVDVPSGAIREFPNKFSLVGFTSWLPDGSGIVFVAPPPDAITAQGGGQIWIQPYPDGDLSRVTHDLIDYRNVTVSADGQSIVTIGSDSAPTLWLVPLDRASEARRIPSVRYDGLVGLGWMPDGRLLFTTRVGNSIQIAIMNGDGTDRHVLTVDGAGAWPQATADGRTIVFVASRGDQRGIWRMNSDGSDARIIAPVTDASYLAISPDGRTVFFTSARDGSSSTWRVPLEGGTPALAVPLLDRAAVSADGRFLAGISRASDITLTVVRVDDGQTVHTFTGQPLVVQGGVIEWTADGTGLLFTTGERTNLWLQRLSGGDPVRVTNFSDQTVFRGDRSPDGRMVLTARGSQVRDAFLITNFR